MKFLETRLVLLFSIACLHLSACVNSNTPKDSEIINTNHSEMDTSGLESAILGGGCFWCVEAVYQEVLGVHSVRSGYSGGREDNPEYRQVASGQTGHAEVVQVFFDPNVIGFSEILEIFFATHDPTTLNRQGNDSGPQYRSVIFYQNEEQRVLAEQAKATIAPEYWDDPIVTEIAEFQKFYVAESYHQNYFRSNPNQPYCAYIINPKLDKFRKKFDKYLRKD
jgi:peptide-methionine (S)-S-oxide reductase